MTENIDHVIYINLDKRTDRKERIETELNRIGIQSDKYTRYAASDYNGNPNAGCLQSHANALALAYDLGFENVLILEDDFVFINDIYKIQKDIAYFFNTVKDSVEGWDVIMFTTCSPEPYNQIQPVYTRIHSSTNGAGYLVNRRMMMRLSTLFRDNIENLYQSGAHWLYQNDILWKGIMADSDVYWYMFNHYLGYQIEGHSDLSNDHKISIIPQTFEPSSIDYNIEEIEAPGAPDPKREINWEEIHRQAVQNCEYTPCSIVNTVIKSFVDRANFGYKKYGQTLDRTDLGLLDWIQHAQEEHMDAILYLERIKKELNDGSNI